MSVTKTLIVAAIEKGTVIDHIDKGQAIRIVNMLKLDSRDRYITLGLNFKSSSKGIKEIIKIEGVQLQKEELEQIVIFSPEATINIIESYEIIQKFKIQLPRFIKNLSSCPNGKCITNHESMESSFEVIQQGRKIELACHYCRKIFDRQEIFLQRLINNK